MKTTYDWQKVPYSCNSWFRVIGTIQLKKSHRFTQYGQNAADTDYVQCEPQTVELKQYDGKYWVGASFNGKLDATTINYQREIGQPMRASVQTQAWAGIGHWMECDLYKIEITHPDLEVRQVAQYNDGRPMLALQDKA